MQVYLLRYFRTFKDSKSALAEATVDTPYGRQCREAVDDYSNGGGDDDDDDPDGENGEGNGKQKRKKRRGSRHESSRWLYLANVTLSALEDQKIVQFVNIAKAPKITVKPRGDALGQLGLDGHGGGGGGGGRSTDFLDHFRVQSEFYFAA